MERKAEDRRRTTRDAWQTMDLSRATPEDGRQSRNDFCKALICLVLSLYYETLAQMSLCFLRNRLFASIGQDKKSFFYLANGIRGIEAGFRPFGRAGMVDQSRSRLIFNSANSWSASKIRLIFFCPSIMRARVDLIFGLVA